MGQFSSWPIGPFDKENIRKNMFDFDLNAYGVNNELMDFQEEISECLNIFKGQLILKCQFFVFKLTKKPTKVL